MIPVEQAAEIILQQNIDYGTERIALTESLGRVLCENLIADRNLPPFDRVSMDGIAIQFLSYEKGRRRFKVQNIQAAGQPPASINSDDECIEIMTGAVLPPSADTVIRYEDLDINANEAVIRTDDVKQWQNIHRAGKDKQPGEIIVAAGQKITPAIIGIGSSIGARDLCVKKLPSFVVISTGDELVDMDKVPLPYQIRNSNNYTIQAALKRFNISSDSIHVADDPLLLKNQLKNCLEQYDVLILTGGISAGKFDYVPKVLEELSVQKLFYKVRQRPGKPFWFGRYQNKLVFGLPGNPVSSFLCLHRYIFNWLENIFGSLASSSYAVLNETIEFQPLLTYFVQVKIHSDKDGKLVAVPLKANGSGDFSSLADADAFMELPEEKNAFSIGEVFRIWWIKK